MRLLSSGSTTSDQSSFLGLDDLELDLEPDTELDLELDFELDLELELLLLSCLSCLRSDISVSVSESSELYSCSCSRMLNCSMAVLGGALPSLLESSCVALGVVSDSSELVSCTDIGWCWESGSGEPSTV
jgi:hypothetical protein